ncbi:hypothetical protein [Nitrosospira sp. NpAV]|uniref:hypothetical protein n=1 Tax=Nitrosospira sp. NpAV TaxID=58133 RepID=UPI0018DDE2BA|nr:hypothetical protein [Nitrosospira sp. NpAV]
MAVLIPIRAIRWDIERCPVSRLRGTDTAARCVDFGRDFVSNLTLIRYLHRMDGVPRHLEHSGESGRPIEQVLPFDLHGFDDDKQKRGNKGLTL